MRRKAGFEVVNDAVTEVHRKHRKAAMATGMSFLEFLQDTVLYQAMVREEEEVCVLLGWSAKEFFDEEHRQIMAALVEEN
jgi:hypothetical protein